MTTDSKMPELKEILGSLIFAARHPLPAAEMRKVLVDVAKAQGGFASAFGQLRESDVVETLKQLSADVEKAALGFHLTEAAGGYKYQSDDRCGPWVRTFLNADKTHRLSRPSLETLAIVAYRQPITRVEIEAVRGVNVDHIIATLMEMELVRMVGRSEAPGRPMLFGTTKKFLEHFGLQSLQALPGIEELARAEKLRAAATAALPLTGEEAPKETQDDSPSAKAAKSTGDEQAETTKTTPAKTTKAIPAEAAEKTASKNEELIDEDDSDDEDDDEDEDEDEDEYDDEDDEDEDDGEEEKE